jgi:hypothetical protein
MAGFCVPSISYFLGCALVVVFIFMHEGFTQIHVDLRNIREELRLVRADVSDLYAKYADVSDFAKEIYHALDRVRGIEKHLNLQPAA